MSEAYEDQSSEMEASADGEIDEVPVPVQPKPPRPYVRALILAVTVVFGLGVLVISGFIEGKEEAAVEAEREGAIKAPLRVKLQPHGEPIVTLDAATQKRIDLRTIVPTLTHYEDQVRAYGRVVDLANLTMLNTNYVAATSQLNTAKAHLAASQPSFERAQSLYERNIDSLAQKETAVAGGARCAC